MQGDYVPRADDAFDAWQRNFTESLDDNQVTFNLTPADLAPLLAAQTQWRDLFAVHVQAQAAARAATAAKDAGRAAYVALIRRMAAVARLAPDARVNDWQALGLGERDATRTPAPTPTSRPLVRIDASQRLRHDVRFTDEASPTRRAKPRGFAGAEVWVRVAAPTDPLPSDPAQFRFLAQASRSPYRAEHAGADAGKTAHYLVRWVNTRGAKGPWSETASATIAM